MTLHLVFVFRSESKFPWYQHGSTARRSTEFFPFHHQKGVGIFWSLRLHILPTIYIKCHGTRQGYSILAIQLPCRSEGCLLRSMNLYLLSSVLTYPSGHDHGQHRKKIQRRGNFVLLSRRTRVCSVRNMHVYPSVKEVGKRTSLQFLVDTARQWTSKVCLS